MGELWQDGAVGVLRLPSGRLVRGRGLSRPVPDGPEPAFGVYLLGRRPPETRWAARWVRWRDFWLPADRDDAAAALREAWQRAATERVELACLAVLDGVPATDAVDFVRAHYSPRAVETPWQRRYVRAFRP